MAEVPRERVCSWLEELEIFIADHIEEIPAGMETLFHVRRALELAKCSPPKRSSQQEKELFERGLIIE